MTKPWTEIKRFYQPMSHPPGMAMYSLVSSLESSPFATGVFGWTSMLDLCITQTPVDYPYHGPYLRLSPKSDGAIEFRYLDTPDQQKQWRRVVPSDQAFARLRHFFHDLHWFTSAASHP